MFTLRNRLLLIGALLIAFAWALFPRTVLARKQAADGSVTYESERAFPLKRGLDLAGGMYMSLSVDESRQAVVDKADQLDRALTVLRTRIDQFGVVEPIIQRVGDDRITVELPGIDDEQRALDIVRKQAFLEFQITDKSNALERAIPRLDEIVRRHRPATATAARGTGADTAPNALTGLFANQDSATRGADSTAKDSAASQDSANAALFGASREGPLSKLLSPGQTPGEYLVAGSDVRTVESYLSIPEVRAALPPGKELLWGSDSIPLGNEQYRPLYMVEARPIITGDALIGAVPQQNPSEGTVVAFTLSNEGGRKFRQETSKHVGDYMAIVLDEVVMGRPPVIQSAIGTRGQITMGGRRFQDATDLALVLRAGALPVPLRVEEVRKIGPSLGEDAIRQGRNAGMLAVGLVVAIMLVYYRFSGFLAVVGLMFYTIATLAVLAAFGAALTLPGLAGFVLSIGMAVDANFLIFERIREELQAGKSVRTSINEGFDHAWSAIVDTHVTTALTAVILYQFGTGPVRGFAVALLAGLGASMVSAIFVVRTLFLLWLQRSNTTQTLSI
jgi:preprotein translocase subunit SecD